MKGRRAREAEESYRRTALVLSRFAAANRGEAVQVASATRREGTTTVVLSLARQLHEFHGMKVLVIEAGEREDLTSLLDLDATRSVSAYVAGNATAADCVQATAAGAFVIPASKAPVPAAQLTARLRQLLRDVAIDFDCVLIDVPPILEKTDAMVIGAVVPRLLLVVEAGRTRHEVVLRAKKELQAEGVEIMGTVLNKHRHFIPLWIYRWLIG